MTYRYFTDEGRRLREAPLDDAAASIIDFDHALRRALGIGREAPITTAHRQAKELALFGLIADLTPLCAFPNLESLHVESPLALDLSPLIGLTTLRRLTLSGVPELDLAPLARLGDLTELRLSSCGVDDLRPLTRLTKLTEVHVIDCPIRSVGALGRHDALRRLFLRKTLVSDLSPLAGAKSLAILDVAGSPVTSAAVAATLPSLKNFSVKGTLVTSVDDVPTRAWVVKGLTPPAEETRPPQPSRAAEELLAEWSALNQRLASLEDNWTAYQEVRSARDALDRALVATRDPTAFATFLAKGGDRSFLETVPLRGLVFGGGAAIVPFAPNPWNIPGDATLEAAVSSVWGHLEQRCPRFLAGLRRTLVAVACVEPTPSVCELVYVTMAIEDPDLTSIDQLPPRGDGNPVDTWPEGARLRTFVGSAKVHLTRGIDRAPPPLACAELGMAHAALSNGAFHVDATLDVGANAQAQRLTVFVPSDRITEFRAANRGDDPDRYVVVGGDLSADSFVLDLERLDPRGDPFAARWDHETWEVGLPAPFWHWFEEEACRSFFGFFASPPG